MADQVYVGEDDLSEIGSLKDIQVRLPLMNQAKPKREKLQLVSMKLTNEPKGNGAMDAKGVFITSIFGVIGGENDGREFPIITYADPRVGEGKKQSAYKSMAMPFLAGLAVAVHGSDVAENFYQNVIVSKQTALEDLISKARSMAGMQFSAEVGIEKGGTGKDKLTGAAVTYSDKQAILAWIPKGQ